MTEAEWLECTDLKRMLRLVRVSRKERKLRLFAVACCRRVWDHLTDTRCRNAIDAAERMADGDITTAEVSEHREAAYQVANARAGFTGTPSDVDWYAMSVAIALIPHGERFAGSVYSIAGDTRDQVYASETEWRRTLDAETDLLREIFGNVYRPITCVAAWLRWNNSTVQKMAQAIYDDRAFDRLPILADALEEAGCTDADILQHCRLGGEHVRGCWVVDLLLGKE
jgi:hypothetical protein